MDDVEPIAPSDPSHVYTYATDKHGHTSDARARIPPWVETLMLDIVASPLTPYTNSAQLFRDAIIHRALYWQAQLGPDSPPSIHIGIARARLEDRRRHQIEVEDFIHAAETDFDKMVRQDRLAFHNDLVLALQVAPYELKSRVEALLDRLPGD